ncbi:hypothetical protein BKA81DRAFT_381938 [Phyllosticta paracitricarpa]|uniref:Secreted protein n=1 Tax=Phyllosticta citricarpa TaxID=55181 RepID=A0ABR1LBJ8_9PEZI
MTILHPLATIFPLTVSACARRGVGAPTYLTSNKTIHSSVHALACFPTTWWMYPSPVSRQTMTWPKRGQKGQLGAKHVLHVLKRQEAAEWWQLTAQSSHETE